MAKGANVPEHKVVFRRCGAQSCKSFIILAPGVNFIKLWRTAKSEWRKSARKWRLRNSLKNFLSQFHHPLSKQQIFAEKKPQGFFGENLRLFFVCAG
jgi:hypothetical protein